MSITGNPPKKVLRQHTENPRNCISITSNVANAIKFASNENSKDQVTNAMIARFAKYMTKKEDAVTGASTSDVISGYEFKHHGAVAAAIGGGFQEILTMNMFPYILDWHRLFGVDGESYTYSDDSAEEIPIWRSETGADLEAEKWDMLSKAVGSSVLYLSVDHDTRLVEKSVPITSFFCAFGSHLTDESGNMSPVNKNEIDHASVVAMRLDEGEGSKQKYAAWFGPSSEYETGRHVIYEASQWSEIPPVGDKDATDYLKSGTMGRATSAEDVANPLTLHNETVTGEIAPVYPFTICRNNAKGDGLFPVETTLYEDTVEIAILMSVQAGMLGKSMRGAQVLRPTSDTAATTIPANVEEGLVQLSRGWELSFGGKSAYEVRAGGQGVTDQLTLLANYQHIPPHFVVPSKEGQVPSGIALKTALEDARVYRDTRVKANRIAVGRRYQIERALVNATTGKLTISPDVVEAWDPGEHEYPQDPAEQAAGWKARIDLGVADLADAAQDFYNLENREHAINYLKERNEEKEAPEIAALLAPKPVQNLQSQSAAGRIRAQRQQQ